MVYGKTVNGYYGLFWAVIRAHRSHQIAPLIGKKADWQVMAAWLLPGLRLLLSRDDATQAKLPAIVYD